MSIEITLKSLRKNWARKLGSLALHSGVILLISGLTLGGCATVPSPSPEESAKKFIQEQTKGAVDGVEKPTQKPQAKKQSPLPVRYQTPSYSLGSSTKYSDALVDDSIQTGIEFYPTGPMTLRSILSILTNARNLSVSWESDVNIDVVVHVPNIKKDTDFFKTIEDLLLQNDYSYEVNGRTIIVTYKETKKFHIAMPFLSSTFSTSVGGDVLGSTQNANMSGTLNISSQNNAFDIWGNIQTNLDKILEIWGTTATAAPTSSGSGDGSSDGDSNSDSSNGNSGSTTVVASGPPSGRGYYTIDKPIGLITVTAPKALLAKIESYLDNLKTELYRQVSIEAKIIEVTMTDNDTTGINWADLFTRTFDFAMDFAKTGIIKSASTTPGSFLTIGTEDFDVIIDAMKKQGHVEVLSNPKISVMNGQPAMISVGENVTYVDSVSSTTEDGVISYSINTATVMSGLGLGVVASIMDSDEVILSITPVTSDLTQPIDYLTFGTNQVGLPKVNLRELNTVLRVKNGEMLIIGGLIDNSSKYDNDYVAGLGEVPVAGQLFRTDGTATEKKELIILLRPQILSL